MDKKRTTSSLLLDFLLLLLAVAATPARGRENGAASFENEIVVSTEEQALDALWSLRDGQTLRLRVRELQLNATLTIQASHVAIYGSEQRTRVCCPKDGGAFMIKGRNVSLMALELNHCQDSALVITGGLIADPESPKAGARGSRMKKNVQENCESSVRVTGCVFKRNWARRGAAIHAEGSILRVQNSAFVHNTVWQRGGALYASSARISVERSNFTHNKAKFGGAVCSRASRSSSNSGSRKLTIVRSRFEKNTAEDAGGAIYVTSCRKLAVEGSHFRLNTAEDAGGAIDVWDCRNVAIKGSSFWRNTAEYRGGAVDAWSCAKVTVDRSRFRHNTGDSGGGAIQVYSCPNAAVAESTFERNVVKEDGGAINAERSSSVSISRSTFERNVATKNGGALAASQCQSVTVSESVLEQNSADSDGGAMYATYKSGLQLCNVTLENNRALQGGAVSVTDSTELIANRSCKLSTFRANRAFQGGGLFCSGCDVLFRSSGGILFQENVAAKSGGGAFVQNVDDSELLRPTRFVRNAASFGGGLATRDCRRIKIASIDFKENLAIDGGGLYISSAYGQVQYYDLGHVDLNRNRACGLTEMIRASDDRALGWAEERESFLKKGEQEWLQLDERFEGRGGGGFIALRDQREDSSFTLDFRNVTARNNSASVGGGVYMDKRDKNVSSDACPDGGLIRRPCLHVRFSLVKFVDNTAFVAAGGLFVRSADRLHPYGISSSTLSPIDCGTQGGFNDAPCYRNNRISCNSGRCYGEQFATGAQSLEWQNVRGPLTGLRVGEKLVVRNDQSESRSGAEDVTLVVKDALQRTVKGKTEDGELVVNLLSNWTTGPNRYTANDGTITIDSTYLAGVNISDILVLQSDDERKIEASLQLSIVPCENGALPTESQSGCFRCPARSYGFRPDTEACRECETHAECGGTTTLVPDDGYWHSTPFSPFIRRCPVKEACSFEGRAEGLAEYYKETDVLEALQCFNESIGEDQKNCSVQYDQCAAGYGGVLCGQCVKGYGHGTGGICQQCSQNLAKARFLTILGIIILLIVLTVKVSLGANGVKERVSKILADKKNAVRATLEKWIASSSSNASKQLVTDNVESDESSRTAIRCSDERTSARARLPLKRTKEPIEDPFEDTNSKRQTTPSPALFAASNVLVSTFNILFNYVQLSSVALHLDVNWKVALNYFFVINGAFGRVLRLEFLPLDCNFADGDEKGTPNSIAVLWYRFCFPLMAMVVYLLLILLVKFIRKERKLSRYVADAVPSLRLIFLVVYLAFCIDLVADLLKVFNCHDLSSGIQDDHIYRDFEDLELVILWLEDTGVECWEGVHHVSAVFAAIGLLLCFLVIVFMVVILYRGNKTERLDDPTFVRSYGMLYLAYKTKGLALHWESIITVRKMLFAAIEVFVSRRETSGVQIGLFSIVVVFSLALHYMFLPFREEDVERRFPNYAGNEVRLICPKGLRDRWVDFNRSVTLNGLEGASLFLSLSFFIVAGCIADAEANQFETNILLFSCFSMNATFLLFMLYRMWYGLHQYLDALADDSEISFKNAPEQEQDRDTYLLTKIWKLLSMKREQGDEKPVDAIV